VRFGSAILTAVYRFRDWHGLRPCVGAGGAHPFILKADDRSLKDLEVKDGNGFVVQAGVQYRLSRKWELFADYKHIWLSVHATGVLAGEPIRAKVTPNPDLMSVGIKFHFD
jgi:outer membrane protein